MAESFILVKNDSQILSLCCFNQCFDGKSWGVAVHCITDEMLGIRDAADLLITGGAADTGSDNDWCVEILSDRF